MDKIIILIFILIFFLLCYLNYDKFKETFSNQKFVLINSKEASEVIFKIDTFNIYNDLDKKLRNIRDDENISSHYINKLDNWKPSEIKIINWLCKALEIKIPSEFQFLINNVGIAKFKRGVEMDFPHTNGSTIFLSEHFINTIVPYFNNNDLDKCIRNIGSIIIHETVHIWQRRDPEFFLSLYKKWRFQKYNKIINSRQFKVKNRYNPDGVDLNWCFKDFKDNQYMLLSTYKENAKNISHVNLIGIEVEKLGIIPVIPPIPNIRILSEIEDFQDYFGDVGGNNYHPNELAAEIISMYVIEKMRLNTTNISSPAKLVFISHFNNYSGYK